MNENIHGKYTCGNALKNVKYTNKCEITNPIDNILNSL